MPLRAMFCSQRPAWFSTLPSRSAIAIDGVASRVQRAIHSPAGEITPMTRWLRLALCRVTDPVAVAGCVGLCLQGERPVVVRCPGAVGGEQHAVDVESLVFEEHRRSPPSRARSQGGLRRRRRWPLNRGIEVVDLGAGQHALVIASGDTASVGDDVEAVVRAVGRSQAMDRTQHRPQPQFTGQGHGRRQFVAQYGPLGALQSAGRACPRPREQT